MIYVHAILCSDEHFCQPPVIDKFKPQFSAKDRCVDQYIWTAEAPCFGWGKWPCIYSAKSKHIMLFLCRLFSWTEITIRSHFTAAVLRLIDSYVNFDFSCSLSVMWTSPFPVLFTMKVWCPTVFASLEHHVLLKFGLQNTLSYSIRCSKNVQHCLRLKKMKKKMKKDEGECTEKEKNLEQKWLPTLRTIKTHKRLEVNIFFNQTTEENANFWRISSSSANKYTNTTFKTKMSMKKNN